MPHLRRAVVALAVTLVVSAAGAEARAQGARERYERVRALEAETRSAVEQVAPEAGTPDIDRVVRPARRVVAEYEAVVRRYPTTGYADNALQQAGGLSQWLYDRYGRAVDRTAATRYFTWLIREYPGSSLRAAARTSVRALEKPALVARAPKPAAAPPPAGSRPADRADVPVTRTSDREPSPVATAPPAPAAARTAAVSTTPVTLRSIEREVLADTVRVTLGFDREVPFSHEIIGGPPRAFVDVFGAVAAETLKDATIRFDGDAVRQVRVGRRTGAVRVVLDLDGAGRVSVFTLYNPYRVVIDADRRLATPPALSAPTTRAAVATGAATVPAPMLPAATVAPAPDVILADDSRVPLHAAQDAAPAVFDAAVAPVLPPALALADTTPPPAPPVVAAPPPSVVPPPAVAPPPLRTAAPPAPAPLPTTAAEVPPAAAPSAPSRNANGTFSMARQLGLGISRIVIDPGHGGHDPGTPTSGTSEARLVLDVALRLEKLLVKDGFDVVLTRRTDVYVPLEERTAIANRERADLFLSIHANSGRDPKARGVEVYYLSFASNPEAEAVAARENATSTGGMHNLTGIVRAIALNNKLDESRDLAQLVQASLATRLAPANEGLRNRGVKKAPFVVLIGAQMPSVLAEIGFITNRPEVALLKTPAYRQRIAESLQTAVGQYQRALKRGAAAVAER